MKLTISRKLLLSYLAMALLAITASIYAIYSLQNLSELAYIIIDQDFFVTDVSKHMVDALVAQEAAEKKYLILRDPAIAELFWTRSEEFNQSLEKFKKTNIPGTSAALLRLSSLHNLYDELFYQQVELVQDNRVEDAAKLSETESKKTIEEIATSLREVRMTAEKNIDTRMNLIKLRAIKASRMTMTLTVISLVVGLSLALIITYNISKPLNELKKATGLIAEGKFESNLNINRQDEMGSLAEAFGFMTERLKVLETLLLDASPLTRLPGNLAIEKEMGKRFFEKRQFSLCHVDLDNFKPFADKYGYAWGSEVIKEVAQILITHVPMTNNRGDFVGHIGGDDFIILSDPGHTDRICQNIVDEFDRRITRFYSEKDREKGFIIGKDRLGIQQRFPLITVTIAIVTDDGTHFKDPLDMAKKAAELKEYAKTLPGSNYVKLEDMENVS